MESAFREKMSSECFAKLEALGNNFLLASISEYINVCNPDSVYICDDSDADAEYIRNRAQELGEEQPLAIDGHTVHFDGYNDQARDKINTCYLVSSDSTLGKNLNSVDCDAGMGEIHEFLRDSMIGKQMYIRFFCLGPVNSSFSISCVQLTDSTYVAHSEDMLYRRGYEQFKRLNGSSDFFRFVHTAGELENNVSKHVDKRRVYIDLDNNIVFSTNTQYAGNTVGLKKLAMRLAINKSKNEGWLTEHMFVMGVNGPGARRTYFTGAFPSACGKTSTAMLPGESIVGDDIAYLRARDGMAYAVNVETGIFGIIADVSDKHDPVIWRALTTPGEVIFSNVLVSEDKRPYWLGMGVEVPETGMNFSGEWFKGKTDETGREIPCAHKNARYTISLNRLANCDENLDNPNGVPVGGFVYGGRDSDTSVPVVEARSYEHGILMIGSTIESETTAATLGQEGVRKFNLMSILDFLSYPLGEYIMNNIRFGRKLDHPPKVFGVNYFQKGSDGKYLTGMHDKHVWLKWAELRVHDDVDAITTPVGLIPQYADLKALFSEVLQQDYAEEQYIEQFTIRIPQLLAKIERIRKIYTEDVSDTPSIFFEELDAQAERLEALKSQKGEYVSPADLV
jgi:phosphoenolpyruvate carboxykinase (GTP)